MTATATPPPPLVAPHQRRRNVFLVANNVEELGGVQRVTHNLAVLLQEAGHRVTVLGIQHAEKPHDYGRRPYRCVVLNEEREPPPPEVDGLLVGGASLDPAGFARIAAAGI